MDLIKKKIKAVFGAGKVKVDSEDAVELLPLAWKGSEKVGQDTTVEPCHAPPPPINPTLTVHAPFSVHQGQQCAHQPNRTRVHLAVDAAFEGTGTLTWQPDGITLHDALNGGNPRAAQFTGQELTQGIDCWVEARALQGRFVCEIALTLTLTPAQQEPVGVPARARLTWIALPAPTWGPSTAILHNVHVPNSQLGGARFRAGATNALQTLIQDLDTLYVTRFRRDRRLAPVFCCRLGEVVGGFIEGCEQRFKTAWHGQRDNGDLPANWAQNPEVGDALDVMRATYVSSIKKVCKRVLREWDSLDALFLRPNQHDVGLCLVRVKPTGSDFHRKGQQVFILEFGVVNQGNLRVDERVVYKPRDVKVAYTLFGDTRVVVRRAGTQRYCYTPNANDADRVLSVAEQINAWAGQTLIHPYRVLPGEPLATAAQGDPTKRVRSVYGFMQFLGSERDQDRLVPANDHAQVQAFLSEFGALCAVAQLVAIDDLHFENMRIHQLHPYLTDVEISWRSPRRRTLYNGLLTPHIGPLFITTWQMRNLTSHTAYSRLFVAGNPITPLELHQQQQATRSAIVSGFTAVLNAIANNTQQLTALVAQHFPLRPRYLTQDTSDYSTFLRRYLVAFHHGGGPRAGRLAQLRQTLEQEQRDAFVAKCVPIVGQDVLAFFQQLSLPQQATLGFGLGQINGQIHQADAQALTQLMNWATQLANLAGAGPYSPAFARSFDPPPTFALLTDGNHDIADLALFDIPAYYRDVATPRLHDARGAEVQVDSNAAPYRATYFPHPIWDDVRGFIHSLSNQQTRTAEIGHLTQNVAMAIQLYSVNLGGAFGIHGQSALQQASHGVVTDL